MKILVTERISENRFKDSNGYLIIKDNVIARTGKQTYKRYQVLDDYDSSNMNDDIEVDRPAQEVFSQETIASFENKPITALHPNEKVNSENHKELSKGFARNIKQGLAKNPETGIEEPVLTATVVVTNQDAIDEIISGKWTHWSCGYDTKVIVDGDNIYQTNIRGNHIALCTEPRAGKIASISDDNTITIPHFIQVLTDALDGLSESEYLDKAIKDFNKTYSDYKITKNKSTFKGHVNLKVEKLNENANFYKTFKSDYGIIKFFWKYGFDLQYNKNTKNKHLNYRVYVGDSNDEDSDITMLQNNVDLSERPMKNIVSVLTDALDAQVNEEEN